MDKRKNRSEIKRDVPPIDRENSQQICTPKKRKVSVTHAGECSTTTAVQLCQICIEPKSENEIFMGLDCSHRFCCDCISKHVGSKIQENIATVKCPDVCCECVLSPEFCQSILPREVFERWGDVLCESAVLGSQKFYCPFSDCSALLIDERVENSGLVIRDSECPYCNRLFCAQCKVPWHSGLECEEFQKLNENEIGGDDLKVMELAKEKAWKRCPSCNFFVEKNQGCLHMTCRCGFQFCYGCGSSWNLIHGCR